MYCLRLLSPQLQLPPHHQFEVSASLHRPQVVRRSHDVLCEDVDPLEVLLPFCLDLRGVRRWGCEDGVEELGVGYEEGAEDASECGSAVCVHTVTICG